MRTMYADDIACLLACKSSGVNWNEWYRLNKR